MVFGALRFPKEEGRRPPIPPAVAALFILLFTAGGIPGGTSWIPFAHAASLTTGGGGSSLIAPGAGFWSSAPSSVGIAIAVTAMAALALAATVVYSRRGSLKSPWSRRRKKHALLAKQWKSFFLPDGRLCDGGVKFLKKARSGGVDPTIRAEVWPFLLGVYEVNSSEEERESVRCRNRKEYDNLRRQCKQILRRTEKSSNLRENAESSECSGDLSQVFDPSLDDAESLERSPLSERESLEKEVSQTEYTEREVSGIEGEDSAREVRESEVLVSKHLEGSNTKHSGGLVSKHREGSIFKHLKGSASKHSEGSASKHSEGYASKHSEGFASTHSEGSASTHSEGSGLKYSEGLVSKQSEGLVSKQSEGSVSNQTEGSVSKQTEGSVSKQTEGSVSKQSKGSVSKQSEVPFSKQSEVPVFKQAEGSVSKQSRGSVFKPPGGSVSKHPESSEDSSSKPSEGSVAKQLEGSVSKHHESSVSKPLEGLASAQVVQSSQLAHVGNSVKSEGDAEASEVIGETGSPGDSDSTDSDSSESDEPEIGRPFSSGELEESGIFEPSVENPSTSESESKAKLHTDEDFTTWQRIIRLDAVRANSDWIVYSPTQASITELKARRFAESVGLKDYDHLEPCRVFHAARLLCILEAYALYDPEIGYCQGMSDLLSPIVSVVEDDSEAFWCFVGFMKKARHNFRLDEIGIRRQLSIVSKIIKCKDSHLYSHLEKLKAEDCFFVYRMVVVLFRRELNFDQTLCLWEVIWADQAAIRVGIARSAWGRMRLRAPPNEDLLLYAIAASVLQRRKLIIEKYSSMDDIMRECNSMAGHLDVWKLLDDAHDLVVNLHEKI